MLSFYIALLLALFITILVVLAVCFLIGFTDELSDWTIPAYDFLEKVTLTGVCLAKKLKSKYAKRFEKGNNCDKQGNTRQDK